MPTAAAALARKARLFPIRRTIVLDIAERIIVTIIFGEFAAVSLQSCWRSPSLYVLLLLLSEALPFALILIRKPSSTVSNRPSDWLVSLSGSVFPLLIVPAPAAPMLPGAVCIWIIMTGMFVQLSAKIVLGVSFGIVPANRGVRTLGPYRFVRHPMYAGYTLTHVGLLLAMPSALNAVLYAAALAFQIARTSREERILMRDPDYRAYAARTRYKLLPFVL